jgi:hypothetical protein
MLDKILSEDWSDYDSRKKDNADNFSCEDWELEYLTKKIMQLYPEYPERLVKRAISISCKEMKQPRTRKSFVNRAVNNLVFLMH